MQRLVRGGTVRLLSSGPAVSTAVDAARPQTGAGLRPWLAILIALVGGLALAAAFPPAGIWPLAAVGPAVLTVALWGQRGRVAFAVGIVFGLAFFVPLVSWLVNLAWYAWIALAVAESVIFAVLTIGLWLLLRLRAWPLAVGGWWVAAEAVRDRWPWGGFPWGRLVMSQATAPTVRWTAIGGPPFLTFLIALSGGCLAWVVLGSDWVVLGSAAVRRHRQSWIRARLWPALGLAASVAVAVCGAILPADQAVAGEPTAEVAAIQGNVPHATNLPDLWRATKVTQNHAAATERLAAEVRSGALPAPDVVIWPENSTDQDPAFNPYIFTTIATAVTEIDRPVLVGAVLQDPVRNAGQLWLPGKGPVAVYIKRRLVPFGEVIPFRGLLSKITNLPSSLQPVNFTPGHRAVVFRLGKIRLGDVICYEVGFDGLVRSEVAGGANLLAMQTNDADFEIDGQTGESLQQLAMARIRAIENDRSVVVASTTGISAIIAPDGQLLTSTGTWVRAEIEAKVPLRSSITLANRLGGWPEAVLTWGTAAALAWVIVRELRRRRERKATSRTAHVAERTAQ
ncbi:MAG TPA: apolipoprotein N-acyltransferase [Streptosporangiaceae bacterium]|nr:apolipoprotein N-acyltransferase [Streptosporangiaceae bacterium]